MYRVIPYMINTTLSEVLTMQKSTKAQQNEQRFYERLKKENKRLHDKYYPDQKSSNPKNTDGDQ